MPRRWGRGYNEDTTVDDQFARFSQHELEIQERVLDNFTEIVLPESEDNSEISTQSEAEYDWKAQNMKVVDIETLTEGMINIVFDLNS